MEIGDEYETTEYVIPPDKLYAVVELLVDVPNDEGESDVEKYSCAAATNWLSGVQRIEDGEGHVKYVADVCMWPKNESKLSQFLERRSKPGDDWVSYPFTTILKFCRSIGQAKEQAEKAITNSTLTESDNGLQKRPSVLPSRFGFSGPSRNRDADGESTDDEPAPLKSLRIAKAQNGPRIKGSLKRKLDDSSRSKPGFKSVLECSDEELGTVKKGAKNHLAESSDDMGSPAKDTEDTSRGNGRNTSESNKSSAEGNGKSTIVGGSQSTIFGGSQRIILAGNISTVKKNLLENMQLTNASKSTVKKVSAAKQSEAGDKPDNDGHGKTSSNLEDSLHGKKNTPPKTPKKNSPVKTPKKRSASFSPRKLAGLTSPVSNFVFKREMDELKKSLNSIKITTNKVYNYVCPIVETVEGNDDGRGMPPTPVDSFDNLILWENFLKDHDNSIHIVRLLTERCMSSSLNDSVYGMLKFMLSNKIACIFNYKGKNKSDAKVNKLSFAATRSCTVMNAAMKAYQDNMKKMGTTVCYMTTPIEVGKAAGAWLKDAPKRYLSDLKALKEVDSTAKTLPDDKVPMPSEEFLSAFEERTA